MEHFYLKQSETEKKLYVELLEVTGSLSNLFADSKNPFLYYRAMENIFCKAFDAKNLSRGDVSVDASKNGIGIGLKTFLQNNGYTFQKVAEFNKESYLLRDLQELELIKKVAEMRNERILSTKRICGLNDMVYHMITRSEYYMAIYEEHMDLINIDGIRIIENKKTTIHFTDDIHDYSFNISKSTLLKRFDTKEEKKIYGFPVMIHEDPYEYLLSCDSKEIQSKHIAQTTDNEDVVDYIVLPLYSVRSGKVSEKSGLNQWNAGGRARNDNEVYVPIPLWIHRAKQGFFSYNTADNRTAPFEVQLPNGKTLSMKVAQQDGKALMSNPNSALGEWLLRDVLQLERGKLVTKEQLDIIGIDSIKLSKLKNNSFYLDFLKTGSYEDFEAEFNM